MEEVRFPAVAGSFYASEESALKSDLEGFIKGNISNKRVKALIVPHAGYIYSGKVAGTGYSAIHGQKYDEIFLFGVSHSSLIDGICFSNYKYWETPLGRVEQSKKIEKIVEGKKDFYFDNAPHEFEHSLEVQVPFLQETVNDCYIIPGLIGQTDFKKSAGYIADFIEEDDLIVVSTDLSHYYPYEKAVEIDKETISNLSKLNAEYFMQENIEVCGSRVVAMLIEIAKIKEWIPEVLFYQNSGDVIDDKNRVVGYLSAIFT